MKREPPPADNGSPVPLVRDDRERARLAHVRQELLAPVNAIAGYADILRDETDRLGLSSIMPDIERVLASAEALLGIVEGLLDAGTATARHEGESLAHFQERLLHDLRNPLNVIKGYGEMLLEDVADLGGTALRQDLERLLTEAARLLESLDWIVNFTRYQATVAEAEAERMRLMAVDPLLAMRPPETSRDRPRETGRILVVDDNASNRGLLLRRLEREGHQTIEARSGRQALQILDTEDVDLILLDLMMPDMNGLQVLERLKAHERLRDIPVIMISGLQETASIVRCIEAGAEDYLPKPFDQVLLRARINACLERKHWHDRELGYLAQLKAEKERSDALLRNILPGQIVGRLNCGEVVIADRFENVTILFCDLVGFTKVAARIAPGHLVENLNRIFSAFDTLAASLGIEKIKTIGDAYMAAAGLPEARLDHAEVMGELALQMLETLERLNYDAKIRFRARVGMHAGPVVAGVIGRNKFIYDVWGDTVNVASRLEDGSLPGRIQVSDELRVALEHRYEFEPRGTINIRGKGRITTAFLTERRR
ncbi:adenylate/guanylate cyclase domain-containing protein [Microvirga tunisiensis]|uniref:histidine kinase n=1 Tax=Microvirga tunisiensis TaxID=2108360 RepID=A0A5N7MVZ9_9HYPH|nr:adenylate/guanylate cyclase domain-containing protein [Microvirga tunisiensis]MPR10025.1 response regulator [Microvirga tunisiensis]MPR28216.1 response regulator [Microvirga tunisiensis]